MFAISLRKKLQVGLARSTRSTKLERTFAISNNLYTAREFSSTTKNAIELFAKRSHEGNGRTGSIALTMGLATTAAAVISLLKSDADAASVPSPQSPRLADLEKTLRVFLATDQIETNIAELVQRGKPWNSYHKIPTHPGIIVTPRNTEEVSRVVALCYRYGIPIIPFGGGTSIEGQTLAPHGGVSLDLSQMKAVIALNEQDLDMTVQAGLGYIELNEMLREKGLWFPLDPGPGASIGG
jgi:D-lactate dehydrogenase (cytochrome)